MSSLTISSFLSGSRDEASKVISYNPFYNPSLDREGALFHVITNRLPVLRNSSYTGLYAITYICYRRYSIIHTLLRQNADLSVDVLREPDVVIEHFNDIYELLDVVLRRDVLPRRGDTCDPVN